jgi:hypothetical protein
MGRQKFALYDLLSLIDGVTQIPCFETKYFSSGAEFFAGRVIFFLLPVLTLLSRFRIPASNGELRNQTYSRRCHLRFKSI